jgi:hypothetical protein
MVVASAGATAGPASAANNIKPYGQQEALNDIGYTVKGLAPSSDPVPHNGQLYAANVKVEGLGGWANPVIPFFNARAESGANYRVIGGDVPPAPPGAKTAGKLYFDVVGDVPNSVVYNDGVQDLMAWVPGPQVGGVPSEPADAPGEVTEIITPLPAEAAPTGGDDVAPDVVAPAPFELSPADVAQPGFNFGGGAGGGRHH